MTFVGPVIDDDVPAVASRLLYPPLQIRRVALVTDHNVQVFERARLRARVCRLSCAAAASQTSVRRTLVVRLAGAEERRYPLLLHAAGVVLSEPQLCLGQQAAPQAHGGPHCLLIAGAAQPDL